MKPKQLQFIPLLCAAAIFLSSCALVPQSRDNDKEKMLPENFSLVSDQQDKADRWWRSYGSADLDKLIEQAFSDSLTLQQLWQRLDQSQALATKAGADIYPDLTAAADTSNTRQKKLNTTTNQRETTNPRNYSLGLSSSYEIDFWGRIGSQHQAALLELQATREDISTAAITLAAEVTTRWINIISQRIQKNILEQQLQTNKTYLELVELRYRKSMAPALDVFQQEQTVAQVEAKIPLVESQQQLLLHELAVLLGKAPKSYMEIITNDLPEIGDIPPAGLPVELLNNRPDIKAAWLRLKEADWQVVVARADRLPAINLTASLTYSAENTNVLFDNWAQKLTSGLTGPVFDGNRRKAEVDRTKAVAQERLLAYQQTVLTAIKEVEDALIREAKQKEHITKIETQLDMTRKALDEARQRYSKGIIDYLPVLTELLKVQNLELAVVQKKADLLVFRTDLYRALGAQWTENLDRKGII